MLFFAWIIMLAMVPNGLGIRRENKTSSVSIQSERKSQDQKFRLKGNRDYSLSFTGKFLATVSEDGVIIVWNTTTKKKMAECQAFREQVIKTKISYQFWRASAVSFDAKDERILYFCNPEGFQQWEWKKQAVPQFLATWQQYTFDSKMGHIIYKLDCSKDGHWAAFIDLLSNLTLVDLQKKEKIKVYLTEKKLPDEAKNYIFFWKNSSLLVFNDSKYIKTVNTKTLELKELVQCKKGELLQVIAISRLGKYLAYANDMGELRLYNLKNGKEIILSKDLKGYSCFSFSHNEGVPSLPARKSLGTRVPIRS